MKTVTFDATLNLGDLGEIEATVTAAVYRPRLFRIDDLATAEIVRVTVWLDGHTLDVTQTLSRDAIFVLTDEAFAQADLPARDPEEVRDDA